MRDVGTRECTWHKYRRTVLAVRIPNGHVLTHIRTLRVWVSKWIGGEKKKFWANRISILIAIYCLSKKFTSRRSCASCILNFRRIFVRVGRLCRRIIICNYCCTRLAHIRSWTMKNNCVSRHLIFLFSFLIAAMLCYWCLENMSTLSDRRKFSTHPPIT